jgi:hypothetical protein
MILIGVVVARSNGEALVMGSEERLRNLTYSFLKFLVVKAYPLNVVSHNIAVYKNITMTLNEDLLYRYVQNLF